MNALSGWHRNRWFIAVLVAAAAAILWWPQPNERTISAQRPNDSEEVIPK